MYLHDGEQEYTITLIEAMMTGLSPSAHAAMANFMASLVQFCLLTTGVFLDAAVTWLL